MTSANRSPNLALARLLDEADWTKLQFAHAVNELGKKAGLKLRYDNSSVCHWVDGIGPKKGIRPLVCQALTRRLGRPITLEDAGFACARVTDDAAVGDDWGTDIATGLNHLGGTDMDPTRRAVLGSALFSAAWTIPAFEDVKGRFALVAAAPHTRIGQADVDAIRTMTDHLSSMDDTYGGRAVRPMAAAYLVNTIVPCLRASASEGVRRNLLKAAADHCYLTGYMAGDERQDHLAQRYYTKALQLSAAAGDHLTYATTLRGMSVMAVDLDHGPYALQLAQAAARASPEANPRMQAFLAGQLAHAAAASGTGYRQLALAEIRNAEAAMDRAEADSGVLGRYDPAALNYHRAQVRYALGDKAEAIAALERADRLRPTTHKRTRIRRLGTLAERKLEIGHLDDACKDWHRMLDLYPSVQSGWCDVRFTAMLAALKPHARNHHAASVLSRARSMTGARA